MNIKNITFKVTYSLLLSVLVISCSSTSKESKTKQLYKGVGYTLEEAKVDAIRSALSYKIPQYIFADRVVINSELKKDATISTSSGFIQDFEVIDQYLDKNGYTIITATILVSENKLKRYASKRYEVLSVNSKADYLDSDGRTEEAQKLRAEILATKARTEAEKLRKEEQYKVAVALSDRLFAGYPFNVTEINTTEVEFDPEDEDWITINYVYDLNEDWRKDFWEKIALIHDILIDSGVRSNYLICPNSGAISVTCKRIPADAKIPYLLKHQPKMGHDVFAQIALYDEDDSFLDCISQKITRPIGRLSTQEIEDIGLNDGLTAVALLPIETLSVGLGLTSYMLGISGAVVGGVLGGTAGLITGGPDGLVKGGQAGVDSGALLDFQNAIDDNGDATYKSIYEGAEELSNWEDQQATIFVLGPNTASQDYQSDTFSGISRAVRVRSNLLYSDTKLTTSFKPHVVLSYEGKFFKDVSEEGNKWSENWVEDCEINTKFRSKHNF